VLGRAAILGVLMSDTKDTAGVVGPFARALQVLLLLLVALILYLSIGPRLTLLLGVFIVLLVLGLAVAVRKSRRRDTRELRQSPRRAGGRWVWLAGASIVMLIAALAASVLTAPRSAQSRTWEVSADAKTIVISPRNLGWREDSFVVTQYFTDRARGGKSNTGSSLPVSKPVVARNAGFLLREVDIPVAHSRTTTLTVVLADMPRDHFYEARGMSGLRESHYLDAQTLAWAVEDPGHGVAFAYLWPEGAHYARSAFESFLGANSVTAVLLALGFMAVAAALSPGVGKLVSAGVMNIGKWVLERTEEGQTETPTDKSGDED